MRYRKPEILSEAEVQAEFYRRCRNAGLEIHLQYQTDARCRFDCVIVRSDSIVVIVECKKRRVPKAAADKVNEKNQQLRYLAFGVPLVYVRGMDDIERAYGEVRRIIAARSGGGWKREGQSHARAVFGSRSVDVE